MTAQRRIVVTGGAGFIGSHLVDGLLAAGHLVCVIDNESTGDRDNVGKAAQFVHGDVRHDDDLRNAFDPVPDAVFHVAGQASIKLAYANPEEDLGVNVGGTIKVLEQCLELGVPRLHLSASYRTVAGVLARAEAERGRKRLSVELHHLDSHGVHAVLSTSKAGISLLEPLYDAILSADDYDDVFLREPGGDLRTAATRLAPLGAGGQP